jgi:hypothetical protein
VLASSIEKPPASESAQAHFKKLRQWAHEHCLSGHLVRDAVYQMSLSAVSHRLLKYGPDEWFNSCSARDLMNLLIYVNGHCAEYLIRTAFFRAIIENDSEVYEHLANTLFMPECRAWYWTIVEGILGQSPDPDDLTKRIDAMQGEEKSIARLMVARVYPDTAHLSWLTDLPEIPRLQAELCLAMQDNKLYRAGLQRYLREHPEARWCVPQEWWRI